MEQEVQTISASPTSDTTMPKQGSILPTPPALDVVTSETKDRDLPKAKLIAQRKARKQIKAQIAALRRPIPRGEVYDFLQQIDTGMTKMDAVVSQHQNVIAFLVSKGVFIAAEFETWENEQKAKIEAAKLAKNAADLDEVEKAVDAAAVEEQE